jgi:hypothetical protein
MAEVTSVDDALKSFREMMAADGYALTWSEAGEGKAVVKIAATESACEDCLAPLTVITNIMAKALAPTDYELDHVELPAKTGEQPAG